MKSYEEWKNNINYFFKNRWYMICVTITAVMSFGFTLTNPTISIDDLSIDYYFKQGGLLAQGRFTPILLDKIFHIYNFRPFMLDGLAVLSLIAAAILWSTLFKKVSGNQLKLTSYIVFSSLFISYPLLNEIFIYMGFGFSICLGHALIPLLLILTYDAMEHNEIKRLIPVSVLASFTFALYESLVAVYLLGIFTIFILQYFFQNKYRKFREMLTTGAYYALPMFLGVFIFKLLSKAIFIVGGISKSSYADNSLQWSKGIFLTLKELILELGFYYGVNAFVYLPITFMVIAVLITIAMIIRYGILERSFTITILFLGSLISLIALSILQGSATKYRACLVFSVFNAFIFMLLFQFLQQLNKRIYIRIYSAVLFVFVIWQVNDLNKWFYCDFLRYQEEENAARLVGYELEKEFDLKKPVVFVGNYQVSDYIKDMVYVKSSSITGRLVNKFLAVEEPGKYAYKLNQTNGVSFLDWGVGFSFPGNISQAHLFFQFLGYDFVADNEAIRLEAMELTKDKPEWPKKGSIYETENYVVVNFGNY